MSCLSQTEHSKPMKFFSLANVVFHVIFSYHPSPHPPKAMCGPPAQTAPSEPCLQTRPLAGPRQQTFMHLLLILN